MKRRSNAVLQPDDRSSLGCGAIGRFTACTSAPASTTWNEAVIVRMMPTPWRAVTRRLVNDRPSRTRSTS